MEVPVRVPAQLQELVGGERVVMVDVAALSGARPDDAAIDVVTVGSVLEALAVAHPVLERRVRDERGRVRTHVNLFVGADNVRDLDGLLTSMGPGDELSIIAAISGG